MSRLTQAAVEQIKPDPTRRLEISDATLPALRLVVQPSGSRSWAVRTKVARKPIKLTLGSARELSLAEARKVARAKLVELAETGRSAPAPLPAPAAHPLGEVAEAYLRDTVTEIRAKTRIERERHLRRDWAPLHDQPIGEIRRADLLARLAAIKAGHGPIAANRSRSTLHALFAWAIEGDYGLETNPVAAIKRPAKLEPTRDRVLSLDELRALWAATASGSDHDAILRLLMLSGQRRDEVGSMRWDELDLPRRRWMIPSERAKNGRAHIVPLSEPMLAILEGRDRTGRAFVFGEGKGGYSGWSRSKARLDRRLKLAPWTLHDLRRSFVTHLIELGTSPAVVEAIVNHQSGVKAAVAGTYDRSQLIAQRAAALQRWADVLVPPAHRTAD